MAKNEHGIELPILLGTNLNRAMFEGNTTFIFTLLADYLLSNNLQVPASVVAIYKSNDLYEKE